MNCNKALLCLFLLFHQHTALGEWSLKREIEGLTVQATSIVCCTNGDMVVAGTDDVSIVDSNGKYKTKLKSTDTEPNKQIGCIRGVAVSPLGYILIIGEKGLWVFDLQCKYLHCFNTLTPDDDPKINVDLKCIAVDREGQVLAGDRGREIITVHTCPDGKMVRKVKCTIGYNTSMVVNSKNQILLHFSTSGSVHSTVVAIDYSGNEVFSFAPKIDEAVTGRKIWSGGIVCDTADNIYIVICVIGRPDTGHIHKYTPTGAFLQCIAQGLYKPYDLSISNDDTLMIAKRNSILKYTRK